MGKMNELFTRTRNAVTSRVGKAGLVLEKYSPEIKLVTGIVCFAGAVGFAYKAGTKTAGIMKRYEENISLIQSYEENPEKMKAAGIDETGLEQARFAAKVDLAKDLLKEVAPVAICSALSLACIVSSNNTLKRRYLGAVAAFNAATEAFDKYRINVKDRFGDDVDWELKNGIVKSVETKEVTDEKGKTKTEEQIIAKRDPNRVSDHAVWFEEGNPNWDPYRKFNVMFLKGQQQIATDILNARGRLFLNEVRESIGLKPVPEGQLLGWIKKPGEIAYVDFGLYDERNADFINGNADKVLLDFNLDGIIWDLI